MSWIRRFDNIRQRDWPNLLSYWAEFGTGFDTASSLRDSLEDFVESKVRSTELASNKVLQVRCEDRTPFLSELVFSQIKANHALLCAFDRITDGKASWGVTDAYHASMLLMRSTLAALGIFICRVHNRYVLVDTFPWSGRIDDERRYKRAHSDWKAHAAVITCTSAEFSQSDLFGLFQRVLNVSTVPTNIWPELVIQNIIKSNKRDFSGPRNRLIYGSRFWLNLDDLTGECLSSTRWTAEVKKDIGVYAFKKTEVVPVV